VTVQTLQKAQSLPKTVEAGLRILASIIAREVVKSELARADGLSPDSTTTHRKGVQKTEAIAPTVVGEKLIR